MKENFEIVWGRINKHQGKEFYTKIKSRPFKYYVSGERICGITDVDLNKNDCQYF